MKAMMFNDFVNGEAVFELGETYNCYEVEDQFILEDANGNLSFVNDNYFTIEGEDEITDEINEAAIIINKECESPLEAVEIAINAYYENKGINRETGKSIF